MFPKSEQKIPELLAPAGTVEVFETAVRAGADAVYIGAPSLNARYLARHFSMAEIAAMIDFAHRHRVKVYVAMNSLMKEEEIPQAAETLGFLEALGADGVILQDLGVYHLARAYFPGLRLHASTLMGAHNSLAVRQFERMGFSRVVLAREMTLTEIKACREKSGVELEVFVHGALCFSYSGLCLFSSYLGGKSGLRGRCVQPCRRRYQWQGPGRGHRSGYFFTMSDLSAIELIGSLKEAGVTSLKIEGRMRSASYVDSVVRAYRTMLDARPGDETALQTAGQLLDRAMGRKTTTGYFLSPQPGELISPQYSGNIGLFVGKVERVKGKNISLSLKQNLGKGDRLRLHVEATGERHSFTVSEFTRKGGKASEAKAGETVELAVPVQAQEGDALFKVDVAERRGQSGSAINPASFAGRVRKISGDKRLRQLLATLAPPRVNPPVKKAHSGGRKGAAPKNIQRPPLELWLKIDDLRALRFGVPQMPDRLVVTLSAVTYDQLRRLKKLLIPYQRRLVWALPPVILEPDLEFYQRAVGDLVGQGFRDWQIGHLGQTLLFGPGLSGAAADLPAAGQRGLKPAGKKIAPGGKLRFSGDYTLNILNSSALRTLKGLQISNVQLSIESDRENLRQTGMAQVPLKLGMTVYGLPPLFTARPAPDFFQYERPLVSPKGEIFVLKKKWGQTIAVARQPFSLLPFLSELAEAGVQYAVIDLSNLELRRGELAEIINRLASGRGKRLNSFNYQGSLQ